LHNYAANLISGRKFDLKELDGKVLLVVNTASHCSFTPQYAELEVLRQKYGPAGFEVLAFPSGSFNNQEFESAADTQSFCDIKFNITFHLFEKVSVKGPGQHPVWKFLTRKSLNGLGSLEPKWNFQKYLLDKKGRLVDVFLPFQRPLQPHICRRIEFLMKQP
jgi:glutathione peroxidase